MPGGVHFGGAEPVRGGAGLHHAPRFGSEGQLPHRGEPGDQRRWSAVSEIWFAAWDCPGPGSGEPEPLLCVQVGPRSQGPLAWLPVSRCQFQGSFSLFAAVIVLTSPVSSTPCAFGLAFIPLSKAHNCVDTGVVPRLPSGPSHPAQARDLWVPHSTCSGKPCSGFPRHCCWVRGFWVHVRRSRHPSP